MPKTLEAWLAIGLAATALGGCSMVTSDRPLFGEADRGEASPEPGLWAVATEDPCALPTDANFDRWPACAVALTVDGRTVRYAGLDPETSRTPAAWLIAGGEPMLVQLDRAGERSSYWRIAPEGPAGGFRRARVSPILCPDEEVPTPGLRRIPDDGCRADTAEALRAIARAQGEEGLPAVWIAPAAER